MNSLKRNSIWLTGIALWLTGQGAATALGQDSPPDAPSAQPPTVQVMQIQTRLAGHENTNDEVYAGEPVQVKFDRALDSAQVSIDSEKSMRLQKTELASVFKFIIPTRLSSAKAPLSSHTFTFSGSLSSDPAGSIPCGSRGVEVYPAPDARVDAVEQRVAEQKNSDVEYLTVKGAGFFAPLEKIHLFIGEKEAVNRELSTDGTRLYAEFNPLELTGTQPVRLEIWNTYAAARGASAEQIPIQKYADETWALGIAGGTFLLAVVLVLLSASPKRLMRLPRPLGQLLLEKQNNTYSLSCFQFYWWGSILLLEWLFLFAARGILANDWRLPGLVSFAALFLISLITLVVAQVSNIRRGPKGSGIGNPSVSDLIMHGGVLAPERVQYLLCTIFSGIASVILIYKAYQTTATPPAIPMELLVVIGLSAVGYLAGKFARKPGPIIMQMTAKSDRDFIISGAMLSVKPRIWLNSVELPAAFLTAEPSDSESAKEFTAAIQVRLPRAATLLWSGPSSPGDIRRIKVMNADGQESEWNSLAPAAPESVSPPAAPPIPASTSMPEATSAEAVVNPVHHPAAAAPVIISTPPEKIVRVVYEQQPDTDTDSAPEEVSESEYP